MKFHFHYTFLKITFFIFVLIFLINAKTAQANHCANISASACSSSGFGSCTVQCDPNSNHTEPGHQPVGCAASCPGGYSQVSPGTGDQDVVCQGLCTNRAGCRKNSTCSGCRYTEDCTTSDGKPGKHQCSGKDVSGTCTYDSGCNTDCSSCVATETPTEVPTDTPSCPVGQKKGQYCEKKDAPNCYLVGVYYNNDCSDELRFPEGSCSCDTPSTPTPQPTKKPSGPTNTPGAQCNKPCSSPAACEGAQGGCTACIDGTCKQPIATPTTPAACNAPCTSDTYCQSAEGCDACLPASGGGKTCQPRFSPDMCKCDGIENTNIVVGQPTTITAYGKVEGADTSKAEMKYITFYVEKQVSSTTTQIIDKSSPIAVTKVESAPPKDRYKASWTYTPAANLDKTKTYRIRADINTNGNCSAKRITFEYTTSPVVAQTQTKSLLSRVYSFVTSLFGGKEKAPVATPPQIAIEPTNYSKAVLGTTPAPTGPLQIGTFYPSEWSTDKCGTITFRFPTLQ